MYQVGGNLFLNLKQMASLIIREVMGFRLLENRPRFSSNLYMDFYKMMCNFILGFVSCVLRVWNYCLLTALQKLT